MKFYGAFLLAFVFHSSLVRAGGPTVDLRPLAQNDCSVQEVGPLVQKQLQTFFETGYYDRTVYFQTTEMNPLRASSEPHKACPFDTLEVFENHGTGNCLGISRYVQK